MSKLPSAETQLRSLKSDLKHLRQGYSKMREECTAYRARATKAEQEAKEWKERFDILLRREDKP